MSKIVIRDHISHVRGCTSSLLVVDVWLVLFTSLNAESTNTWTLCESSRFVTHSLWLKYKGDIETLNVPEECILCILVNVSAFTQEQCQLTWTGAHLRCTDTEFVLNSGKSCECTSPVVVEVKDTASFWLKRKLLIKYRLDAVCRLWMDDMHWLYK